MIYRFILISDEVEDFVREIEIDADATFQELHEAILKCTGYSDNHLQYFYICDDYWDREKMVSMEEIDNGSEFDSWTMDETTLSELIEDEKQKLVYIFDNITERCFFMELKEITPGKDLKKARCVRKEGIPPKQDMDFEEFQAASGTTDVDEKFYGDEDFDFDEFDKDGFSGLDEDTPSIED